MIKFEGVTKIYQEGQKPALEDVSFNIERGEFVFLVGPSGSGKSTLLNLILRSVRPNDGRIFVAGRDLTTLTNWRVPEYRQTLGVVFQDFRLLQNKTVYENVAFALQVIGKNKHEINKLVPEALELVGLKDKVDRFPNQLSGGERQRVAIARAFVNRPLIIMADEPTGNLDPQTSVEIMQIFEMINKMGTTILMSTHSEETVNAFRKRVLEMSDGFLIRDEENAKYITRDRGIESGAQYPGHDQTSQTDQVPDLEAAPEVQITIPKNADPNATIAIGKKARKVNGKVNGKVGGNVASLQEQIQEEQAYQEYFDEPVNNGTSSEMDFFNSGTFDASSIRNRDGFGGGA
jgi:cell division transport system ATP-binding protein